MVEAGLDIELIQTEVARAETAIRVTPVRVPGETDLLRSSIRADYAASA